MTKQRAGLDKYFEIDNILKDIVRKTQNGFCEYISGWNDNEVALKCSASVSSVQTVRKKRYGKLNDGPKYSKVTTETITRMENDITHLLARCADLERRIRGFDNTYANLEHQYESITKWAKGHGYTVPNGRMHAEERAQS